MRRVSVARPPFRRFSARLRRRSTVTEVSAPPSQPQRTCKGKCTPEYTLVKPMMRIKAALRAQSQALLNRADAAVQKAMELKECPDGIPLPIADSRKSSLTLIVESTWNGLRAFTMPLAMSVATPPASTDIPM